MMNLIGHTREDLAAIASQVGLPAYGAAQLYQWIYQKGARSFEAMSNINTVARDALSRAWTIDYPRIADYAISRDGTTKFLCAFPDGAAVEMVMIPADRATHKPRRTLCISSQVGCAMGCTFCHTGTMGLSRHLTAGEIVAQVLLGRDWLREREEELTNVVFMGMGEPLHNYDATMQALRLLTDDAGIGLGRRHVTVSTVGLAPAIVRFGEERLGVKLALSLHATTDARRKELIPLAKRYTIAEILDACHAYCRAQPQQGAKVTFEYLLLKDVNDTPDDAKRLGQLAARVPCKINLIPLNPYPGCPWDRPEDERIADFGRALQAKGIQVNTRNSRGLDILAACGQLATRNNGGSGE
jgi:23S rRNA (adenine2503-C2)-methyltransferase